MKSEWKTAPISPTCERWPANEKLCDLPTAYAYPAAGGGWMALCEACGKKHLPAVKTLASLIRSGEVLKGQEPKQPAALPVTPSRYQWEIDGTPFDFYALCQAIGPLHPAQAHALKKVIRAGRGEKPLLQDIKEAADCLKRWAEMEGGAA